MQHDIDVELENGTYSLTKPFVLTSADSGRGGHTVSYEAAPGAHPVVSGGYRVTGWHKQGASGDVWVAAVPGSFRTRQLYVDGQRAEVAQGKLPVALTQTAPGTPPARTHSTAGPTRPKWRWSIRVGLPTGPNPAARWPPSAARRSPWPSPAGTTPRGAPRQARRSIPRASARR